jgi:hypothetical protein
MAELLSLHDAIAELTHLHPGVTVDEAREVTGWDLGVAADLVRTESPTAFELEALRRLESTHNLEVLR